MPIFSRLHDKDAEIYKALERGEATEGQQKFAAEIILKEMTRADDNAQRISHLNFVINGFERALKVIARQRTPDMTDFDDEMMAALEKDGEYLRQVTGEDHGPWGLCCHCGAMTDHPVNVTCDTCFRTAVEAAK